MTIYIWRDAANHIISFGETPFGLGPGETQEEVEGTMAAYAGRCQLTIDKPTIAADGLDEATVAVTTNIDPAPAAIDLNVGGTVESVPLTDGAGQVVIVADDPGIIQITPDDKSLYAASGGGVVTLEAI